MQQVFYQWFVRLEQFVHTYFKFQMIFDEIRKPRNLKELLIGIDTKLLNNFELPRNHRKKIGSFIRRSTALHIWKVIR